MADKLVKSEMLFDSMNPAAGWVILADRTPEGLLKQIQQIRTPVSIKQMFPYGNRVYARIQGDVRIKRTRKRKDQTDG